MGPWTVHSVHWLAKKEWEKSNFAATVHEQCMNSSRKSHKRVQKKKKKKKNARRRRWVFQPNPNVTFKSILVILEFLKEFYSFWGFQMYFGKLEVLGCFSHWEFRSGILLILAVFLAF